MFIHFGNTVDLTAATSFLCPEYLDAAATAAGLEDSRLYTIPCAGTIRGMYVQALTNTIEGIKSAVVTLRRGAIAGAMGGTACTATLAAGVLNNSDFAHPIAVAAGDRLSIQWVNSSATGQTCTFPQVVLVFQHS